MSEVEQGCIGCTAMLRDADENRYYCKEKVIKREKVWIRVYEVYKEICNPLHSQSWCPRAKTEHVRKRYHLASDEVIKTIEGRYDVFAKVEDGYLKVWPPQDDFIDDLVKVCARWEIRNHCVIILINERNEECMNELDLCPERSRVKEEHQDRFDEENGRNESGKNV